MPARMAVLNSRAITGSTSPMATARTRSGSTAATVRRIRSATRRFEFERGRLDTCVALAGCHRERPLSRTKSGNGVAARGFGRLDGKEPAGAGGRAGAAGGRPSARDAARPASLRAFDRHRWMAASDPDCRKPAGHRVRRLPAGEPAPPAGAGADTPDATGALVLRGRDRAWCG